MTEILLILLAVQNCTTYPVRGSVKSTDNACVQRTYDCLSEEYVGFSPHGRFKEETYKKCLNK